MSENSNRPNNPYASAAGAYDQHAQSHTPDQRELEARVLLKAARKMQDLQKDWEKISPAMLDEALRYNRQIWLMFVDTAMEDEDPGRPDDLRNNIANLGIFIFKRIVDILTEPQKEKLDVLIEINQNIATGLMKKQPGSEASTETTSKAGTDAETQA